MEEQANQTKVPPASSELDARIPTSEQTNEEAAQDDPNENRECNECPPSSEPAEELILSPGFDHFRF